jgi:hypothetical protein
MNRILFIAALLAVFAVTFVPTYEVALPHHDDTSVPHAAEDDDCGCICHLSVDAVVVALTMEIHQIETYTEYPYDHSRPDPIPVFLDRPPELFS